MTVTYRRLSGPEFAILAPDLVDIYITAMGYDPAIRSGRISVWQREIVWPGFTAVAAIERTATAAGSMGGAVDGAVDETVVGIAYGFIGSRERWWDQQLIRGLRQNGGISPQHSAMLRDYFEIAEIHVHPSRQGAGIGRALLSRLLWNAPARWALLSTPEVANESNNAFGLYRSMGFRDILRDFYYAGDDRPFAILGRTLPLHAGG
ncbi:GNAT family N-acetyltransferase [Corynebacterium lipophiloflavum]|uniref:Acetyltransferase, GNAT family n=1 Tax=Corynebacterium lipophiloflavum (strain ATCC 700352 / DSM 44291 / CCUG 37336 / JCM 10383 / DMMZ 1944) TaxID=525263 RepID=C0XRZ4_CORLD|nr:GNAT family N-acetyltransferase [Corynebacterium lipophiloflavum]EEI16992.1 acetyltransferase, GNAT family [Corynebacterium lipophiloflavum DSM 44291]